MKLDWCDVCIFPSGSFTLLTHSGHLVPCTYGSSPPSPFRAARCVITQFANKSSQNVNLSLVNTLFIGSLKRKRRRTFGRIRSTRIGTCPILGLPYSIYCICISMCLCQCLFALPFGVAAVKIHNTTLIRSNGMTLTLCHWLSSALHSKESQSQTPNPKRRTKLNRSF